MSAYSSPPPYQHTSARSSILGEVSSSARGSSWLPVEEVVDGQIALAFPDAWLKKTEREISWDRKDTQRNFSTQNYSHGQRQYEVQSLDIVIHIVGTRGDVAPFLPIASLLATGGHRVRLATHKRFEAMVEGHSTLAAPIDFFPIGADPEVLMSFMVRNGGLIPTPSSLWEGDVAKNRQQMKEVIEGALASCIEPIEHSPFYPNVIIANPPSFGSAHCAEALGAHFHMMSPMPWAQTSYFPHPFTALRSSTSSSARLSNRLSYEAVHQLTWAGCSDLVNDLRFSLGLPLATANSVSKGLQACPQTFLISPSLLPPPPDYGPLVDMAGFCFSEPQTATLPLPYEVEEFLQNGPPPVYCGFGSVVGFDLDSLYARFIEAIHRLGLRAVICRGWGAKRTVSQRDILVLDECPHELLLPRCAAVCHHGGAGSTAAGLRHGKPTIICSFFGDQPFFGRLVHEAGVGPPHAKARNADVAFFMQGLQTCFDRNVQAQAKAMQRSFAREAGAATAVDSLMRYVEQLSFVQTTATFDKRTTSAVAIARHKSSGRDLSLREVCELSASNKVKEKDLEMIPFSSAVRLGDEIEGSMNMILSLSEGMRKGVVRSTREIMDGWSEGKSVKVVKGAGLFLFHPLRSMFLAQENVRVGLHRIRRLYDPTFCAPGRVTSLSSGLVEGSKSFAFNLVTAATDLVYLPIVMGQEEGAIGVARGLGIGYLNSIAKLIAGPLDLVMLPCRGLYYQMKGPKGTLLTLIIKSALERLDNSGGEGSNMFRRLTLRHSDIKRAQQAMLTEE